MQPFDSLNIFKDKPDLPTKEFEEQKKFPENTSQWNFCQNGMVKTALKKVF